MCFHGPEYQVLDMWSLNIIWMHASLLLPTVTLSPKPMKWPFQMSNREEDTTSVWYVTQKEEKIGDGDEHKVYSFVGAKVF